MLAKRSLHRLILGLGLVFWLGLSTTAGAAPRSASWSTSGPSLVLALWAWVVKTVELVIPWGETESAGGYIDPDGRP